MHTKSTDVHNATSNDSCIVKLKWQKYMTTAPKVNDNILIQYQDYIQSTS